MRNFLRTSILKNICERLLLIVVLDSDEEQHLLAKLVENGVRYNYVLYLIRFILVLLYLYSIQKESCRVVPSKGVSKNSPENNCTEVFFLSAASYFINE